MSWMRDATDNLTAKLEDSRARKRPCLESAGVWKTLEFWPVDEYHALNRTLILYGYYGENKCAKLLELYNRGLNLPTSEEKDWDMMREAAAASPGKKITAFTKDEAPNCYLEQLERMLVG